jgi:hypothetical protein
MHTIARHALRHLIASCTLSAALLSAAHAAPHRKTHKSTTGSKWMIDCVYERTGPVGGISKAEARKLCEAEMPDDEIERLSSDLRKARRAARMQKAIERARKAVLACEQAVVDVCVENANPDGSTDCMDEALEHAGSFAACRGTWVGAAKEGK